MTGNILLQKANSILSSKVKVHKMFNIQLYLTVTGNKIMLKIEENFLCICILHPLCIKEKQGWVFFFSFLFVDVI